MQFRKNWTPIIGALPALSIKQPYASAIVRYKVKTIEMRTWATDYRGPVVIHAGKTWISGAARGKPLQPYQLEEIREAVARLDIPRGTKLGDYPLGYAIGIARLVECWRYRSDEELLADFFKHKSNVPFQCGKPLIGWRFEDIQAFDEPVELRGELGLFPCPVSLLPVSCFTSEEQNLPNTEKV